MAGPRLATPADAGGSQLIDGVRMATEIQLRLVAELLPYARNSKHHGPQQISAIAASIQEYGFTNPILLADGGILAGHGRLLAAQKLGLRRVPCIDLSHLSEQQRRAYVIWDNRSGELDSSWNLEMLKLETDELRADGLDLEAATGWSEEDLADLFRDMEQPAAGGDGDPDDAPPLPEVPISVPGDIWAVGEHRIMAGSALEPADWDRLMAGEQADAVWTDPPYNVDQAQKNRDHDKWDGGNRSRSGAIANDKMSPAAFAEFLGGAFSALFDLMRPGAGIYVFYPDREEIAFAQAFSDAGFKLQSVLQWRKNSFVLSRWDHQPITEPCLYGWKPGAAHKWYGGRKQINVTELGSGSPFQQLEDGRWRVTVGDSVFTVSGDATVDEAPSSIITEPRPSKSDLHPTMKPVALVARQLRNSARPGNVVVDAFGGSGSTAVAAHQCGMRSRLMELDPRYVDVIVTRLTHFTGLPAMHAVTGEAWPTGQRPAAADPALPVLEQPELPDLSTADMF